MTIKQKVDLLFKEAESALEVSDLDRALELMTKAITLDPKNPALVQSRGAVHAMKDDVAAAIVDYTKAIALAPTYADAYLNRGLAHWESGAAREAAHDLAKAVDAGLRSELEPQARYFLARAREALGDHRKAYEDYLYVVVVAAGTDYGDDAAARSLAIMIRAEGGEQPSHEHTPPKKTAARKKAAPKKTAARKKR